MTVFDVAIAGGGVNGLACAATLAREGLSVCVVERNPWVGGGAVTREVTLPGFRHDLFGSSHVWIHCNADFKAIQPELEQFGLKYLWAQDHITGHPDKSGGPGIVIYRSIDKTCASIAKYSAADAARYRKVYDDFALIKDGFLKAFFSPPSPPSTMARALENSHEGLRRLQEFSLSARAWVEMNFENNFVKAVMLNWALAPQILPEQEGAGQSFYIMIPAIHVYGQAIPQGGSQELPNAMARYIESKSGKVLTNSPIDQILLKDGRAVGLRLENDAIIEARRAVVSALEPKQTFLKFVGKEALAPDFVHMVQRFSCLFHRIVDSTEQLTRFYADIAMGLPPTDPFLWCACWTKLDPSRAPAGKHTLILDTFVSNWLASGESWAQIGPAYARNTLLKKLQQYAPNINDQTILGMYVETGESLEAANPSFVNGTTNGGERIAAQLGYFRPFPGYAHYRSPIKQLYMTGPHCHPGGGISAMGTITARVMLDDFGLKRADF
jgi:phytoene dehydrogenase-like protein